MFWARGFVTELCVPRICNILGRPYKNGNGYHRRLSDVWYLKCPEDVPHSMFTGRGPDIDFTIPQRHFFTYHFFEILFLVYISKTGMYINSQIKICTDIWKRKTYTKPEIECSDERIRQQQLNTLFTFEPKNDKHDQNKPWVCKHGKHLTDIQGKHWCRLELPSTPANQEKMLLISDWCQGQPMLAAVSLHEQLNTWWLIYNYTLVSAHISLQIYSTKQPYRL